MESMIKYISPERPEASVRVSLRSPEQDHKKIERKKMEKIIFIGKEYRLEYDYNKIVTKKF